MVNKLTLVWEPLNTSTKYSVWNFISVHCLKFSWNKYKYCKQFSISRPGQSYTALHVYQPSHKVCFNRDDDVLIWIVHIFRRYLKLEYIANLSLQKIHYTKFTGLSWPKTMQIANEYLGVWSKRADDEILTKHIIIGIDFYLSNVIRPPFWTLTLG